MIFAAANSVHDATIFLSTLVVLVSVCVGFVGAGVLQVLVLDGASVTNISSRLTRIIVLGVLGALDLYGVFLALGALYSNTINGSISTGTLRVVFISSIIVIAANLALPVWAFSIARAVRWLREILPPETLPWLLTEEPTLDDLATRLHSANVSSGLARFVSDKALAVGYVEEPALSRFLNGDQEQPVEERDKVSLGLLKFMLLGSPENASWLRSAAYWYLERMYKTERLKSDSESQENDKPADPEEPARLSTE